MLTGACLPYFAWIIRIASGFGTVPYTWDKKLLSIKVVKSKFRLTLWLLFVFSHFCYTIFVIVRFVQFRMISTLTIQLIHAFWIILHVTGSGFQLIVLCRYQIFEYLINSLIHFEIAVKKGNLFNPIDRSVGKKRRYFPRQLEDNNVVILIILLMNQTSSPLIFPMLYWFHPQSPQFPGSLFPANYYNGLLCIPTKIFFLLLEFLMMTTLSGNIYFCCSISILAPKCILCYTNFIRFIPRPSQNFNQVIQSQMQLYRQIQILTGLVNAALGDTLVPAIQLLGSLVTILSLYGTLQFYSIVAMPAYSVFPMTLLPAIFIVLLMLESSGKLIQASSRVIKCWGKSELIMCRRKAWVRKFSKSCRSVAIKTGSMFLIRRNRGILLLRLCLQRTYNLMVYFDNNK